MPEQIPGHLAGKKKWLVARYPKPQGELIFLGSILADPEDPETSLNRKFSAVEIPQADSNSKDPETSLNRKTGEVEIPKDDKYDDSAAVRQEIHSELSNNASGLLKVVPPNSPLFNAGVKAEGGSSKEVKTTVEAMRVSAEIFIPTKSYMDKALGRPEITAYVEKGAWSKSLYMIVGVATAETLAVSEEQSQEMNIAASANASLTGTGTETAGELSYGTTAKGGSKLKTENTTDFAYRVREFDYLKLRLSNKFKDKGDLTKGTMFGSGERVDWDPNNEDVVPAFDDWADEDEEVDGIFVLRT